MRTRLFILILLLGGFFIFAQEADEDARNWDNQLYLSDKLTWTSPQWKYSGEVQIRLIDNMQSLEQWFVEGVASYQFSESIEFSPDLRISIKPDEFVIRPGFGMFYKFYKEGFQFVNQVKWQIDFDNHGNSDNAARYVINVNKQFNEKMIASFLAGALYRWEVNFQGIELIRIGPGLTYIFNNRHSLNFNYFLSGENNGQGFEWAGIPFIQLIINIDKEYKYIPPGQ